MDLNRVDLNLLVAFDALMAERSVTKAARQLSIGQSAMSMTLHRLRKLFDDQILVREGNKMVATPLSESLVDPVRELLINADLIFSRSSAFDPSTTERTFSIIANDYLTMTFLHPLLARLDSEAPGIRLHIFPTGDDFADRLRRHDVDLLILPREAFEGHALFPHKVLFQDRYLVAADKNHPDIGDEITLKQFSTLPYLATSSGYLRSLSEMQLDFLGVPRNVEITTAFGLAPFLIQETRLITLIHERLANRVAEQAGLRLLQPPIPNLQPITEIMVWTNRTDRDPGHRWLRGQILNLARELDV